MDEELKLSSDETIRMLREATPEIAKELIKVVRDVAKMGADLAKANAVGQGFTPPGTSGRGKGNLLSRISSGNRGLTGYIKEGATRDGYRYPGIFEYSREYKEGRMRRPFLIPARDEILPYAIDSIHNAVQEALDRLERG